MDRLGGDYQSGAEGRRQSNDGGYPDQYGADQYGADQYGQDSYRVPDPRRIGDAGPVLGPRSGVELPPLPFAADAATGALPPVDPATPPPLAPPPLAPPPLAPSPLAPPLAPPPLAPPLAPPAESGLRGAQHSERTTVRRSGPGSHSGLYLARRAGLVGVLTAVAVVAELLLVRVLVTGEFGRTVLPGSVLCSICAMAGVPLVTVGIYGLMTGVPAIAPRPSVAWLRAPLAYLPAGLVLLLAAGLAASGR